MTPNSVLGVIWTGGRGKRFQQRSSRGHQQKGLAMLAGKPLLLWVASAMRNITDSIVLSFNNEQQKDLYLTSLSNQGTDVTIFDSLVDDPSFPAEGPLKGQLSVLNECSARTIVSSPVDMPFVPPNIYSTLVYQQSAVSTVEGRKNVLEPLISGFIPSKCQELTQLLSRISKGRGDDLHRGTSDLCIFKIKEGDKTNPYWNLNINHFNELTEANSFYVDGQINKVLTSKHKIKVKGNAPENWEWVLGYFKDTSDPTKSIKSTFDDLLSTESYFVAGRYAEWSSEYCSTELAREVLFKAGKAYWLEGEVLVEKQCFFLARHAMLDAIRTVGQVNQEPEWLNECKSALAEVEAEMSL